MARRVVLLLSFAACLTAGCTFNEPRVRPEPVIHLNQPDFWVRRGLATQNPQLFDNVEVTCAEWHSASATWIFAPLGSLLSGASSANDECIYATADLQKLPKFDKGDVRFADMTLTLLNLSDYDCTQFLARAFAFKTNATFMQNLVNSSVSGTAAVTAFTSGVATSGLSVGNAVIGNALHAMNSNYFAGKSFDVMETAIRARREILRTRIRERLCVSQKLPNCKFGTDSGNAPNPVPYLSNMDMVNDVLEYDRTCSLEEGISLMSGAAARAKDLADQEAGLSAPAPQPDLPGNQKPAQSPGNSKAPAGGKK